MFKLNEKTSEVSANKVFVKHCIPGNWEFFRIVDINESL